MKSIIIAAPHSGSGKTTVTLGLMECLKRRGLRVAPFKVGPDFIDPGYHRLVCGRPSINLDGWMCPPEFVRETFAHHSAGADIAVIEGVMGLFDGISGMSEQGSTAQIARIIGSPVILVVDAKSQARSAAALVKGFAEFDPRVRIAGVIFNNVASETTPGYSARQWRPSRRRRRCSAVIPRDERLHIPSRHLGLLTAEENPLPAEFLDHLAEVIRRACRSRSSLGGWEPQRCRPEPPLRRSRGVPPARTARWHALTPHCRGPRCRFLLRVRGQPAPLAGGRGGDRPVFPAAGRAAPRRHRRHLSPRRLPGAVRRYPGGQRPMKTEIRKTVERGCRSMPSAAASSI